MLRLDDDGLKPFLNESAFDSAAGRVSEAFTKLDRKSGAGRDFLGWRDMLGNPNDALLEDITSTAHEIRSRADVLLCIGIGGSYLGARAVIDAATPYFVVGDDEDEKNTEVIFVGHHMSGAYLRELLQYLDGKSVYVNVISKSGTTLEPALAFRFVRTWLERRFEDADKRIIVTTDPVKGALNALQRDHGYKKYDIPPDVGGRFSVLTPVGLLPIAAAGIDIRSLFYGAVAMYHRLVEDVDNPAHRYATARYLLHEAGYAIETMAVFEPRLTAFGAWWQQLFGESEGKDHRGLFPAVVQYSTDLHSVGQYLQDGKRVIVETFLMPEEDAGNVAVVEDPANVDGLNYLVGKTMREVNRRAYEGTAAAHRDGGVPNMTVWIDHITAETIGGLIYFFEHAVAISGYMLGVNPFDQPGVEAYKKEMFRRLGRT